MISTRPPRRSGPTSASWAARSTPPRPRAPAATGRGRAGHQARDPEGDRVVNEHCGSGIDRRDAIDDQRGDQTAVEHADPTGDRDEVGEIADDVTEGQGCQGRAISKGGKHRPEDGDVEEEVADRAQKAPAGPANRVLGLANPLDQIADPGRAAGASGPSRLARGERQDDDRRQSAGEDRQRRSKEVLRPRREPREQQGPGGDHRGDAGRAGDEEQRAGALDDGARGQTGEVHEPTADRQPANPSGRQQHAGCQLSPGEQAGLVGSKGEEEEPKDDDKARAGGKLECDGERDPARAHVADRAQHAAQRRDRE